ncbi:hypothetical protein CAL7716_021480 [Calothrix sp. PCC 7716]|nr:hypothetical protein CAL7716_021480 [Calothrix sp. PCC 7716]
MIQVIKAKDVTLNQLAEHFKLQRVSDKAFFSEWQNNLPELDDFEKQSLNEIKEDFFHLSLYSILEPVVKMVVLSPLLRLAQFYRPPFYVASEQETEIISEDEGTIVRVNLDLLVFQPPFWVAVIESKRADLSLVPAIPQVLAYMLSHPDKEKPCFGVVTNGGEFRFIKLVQQDTPQYAVSDLFALDSRDDIEIVLRVLKRLAQIVSN